MKLVPIEKICSFGRQGTPLLAAFAALALASQCPGATASSVVSSVTSGAPGGFIFDGTRNWVVDGALGLCRMDPGGGGGAGGSFTLSSCVLPPTSNVLVPAIVGQPAYDPATGFVYLPDQSTASLGIWRYSFNVNGRTFGGGVNIAALGAQRPGAIAFGTDGNLYATMTANASILRVNTPAGATQVVDKMGSTISGQPAKGLALVGTQLWVADRDGIIDIVDPIGCATACRGAILTQIFGLTSPLSITWDAVHSYVYMGTPFGVVRHARITGVTDTYSRSYVKGAVPGLLSDVTAVGLDGAGNLLLVDDATGGQVVGGASVYSVPFFIPGSNPPVQSPPDGQGAVPQPPITQLPTIFPIPISNPGSFYTSGLTTPKGAVFMGTHLWVVDAALGFCKVDPTQVPSLTACATLPPGFVPGSPAYDAVGHFVYLADTTAAGAGILRFPFITAAGLTNETLGLSSTVVKITPLTNAAPGSSAPTALAFGPDNQLYVAMAGSTSILRVTAPAIDPKAPAIHAVTSVGTMFQAGSLSVAFHNADLFNTEAVDVSTLFNATLCKGTCSSLFLAIVLNAPGAVAADANFVYIGDAGGIVWRYDPVANTMTRLADTGQTAAGVLTPFTAISGLAVDNLGQVTIVDQTTVWKLSTAVPTISLLTPNQAPESSSPAVTITGTGFLPSLVVTTCAAITPGNVTFVSPTQITATFAINPLGPIGACAVTVATANGTSVASSFKVLIGPPALTGITPLTGFRGRTVPFSIAGGNMTLGVLSPMDGITFGTTVVTDALITTSLIIDPTAAVGPRSVIVTTPSGPSNVLTFNVQAPLPVLTSITPAKGVANTTVPVTIAGTDLFGATLNLPAGFTLSGTPLVGFTSITANLVIASTVPAGPQSITVTTLGGTSNAVTFTILPALTSIAPTQAKAGTAGGTVVTLTGTSLAAVTTINAGANITVTGMVATLNSITATFTTVSSAPLGPQNITVTDPNGTSTALIPFTITAPTPVLTSITPATGVRGTTVNGVILAGSGLVGATFTPLPTGITLSGTPVVAFGQITANFVIATDAPLGPQSINVTTPGGTTTNVGNFTVTAPVPTASIAPAQGVANTTVPVTFTGTGLVGAVLTLPTGFTLSGTPVVASTGVSITASFIIASTVPAGPQSITVTTPGGAVAVTFNILPALTTIAPNQARAGAITNVTLTGTSLLGATSVNAGANITVTNFAVVNATTITATFTSAPAVPVGPVNVTVTGPAGTSAPVVFTLTGPIPVISSISPATGGTGATVPITVTGTGLTLGTLNLPVGVTIVGTPVVSFTQITATLLIAGNAPLGAQSISVTTPGAGNLSNAFPFTVFALAPTLTSVAPLTATAGTSPTVTLTGTGFAAGTTVNTGTAAITVSSFTVLSPTQISATLLIGANAASTQISVSNSNGTSNSVTFGIVPTLASINPTQGVAGTNVPVTLTGTSFTGVTAINTGTAGITATILSVSNTQITATFAIAVGATQGNHSISVTTPGGITAQAVNFNVLPPAPAIQSLNNTSISKSSRNVGMNVNGSNLGNLPVGSVQVLLNGLAINPAFVTITNFQPSQTQIRFNWTFNAAAPISSAGNVYTLNVTTPSGTSNAIPFTVTN